MPRTFKVKSGWTRVVSPQAYEKQSPGSTVGKSRRKFVEGADADIMFQVMGVGRMAAPIPATRRIGG